MIPLSSGGIGTRDLAAGAHPSAGDLVSIRHAIDRRFSKSLVRME
jgi:hypothetical protein